MRAGRGVAVVVLALSLGLAACGGGASAGSGGAQAFSRGEADSAIDVTLRDFAFEGLPSSVTGPRIFVTATNAGPSKHEFEILDAAGETVDEIVAFPAGGKRQTLAVRLEPGTYTIQCIVKTPDRRLHADLGMRASLQVR